MSFLDYSKSFSLALPLLFKVVRCRRGLSRPSSVLAGTHALSLGFRVRR